MARFRPCRIGDTDHGEHRARGNEIVLRLSTGERILAVHRDVRVPLSTVQSVAALDEPIRRIQGLKPRNFKAFGGYWPGKFAYGAFFDGTVRRLMFAAVNGRQPRGLEIALDGAKYSRLIVSLDDPDAARTALTT